MSLRPRRGRPICDNRFEARNNTDTTTTAAIKIRPSTIRSGKPRLVVIEWCPECKIERHTAEAQSQGDQQENQ